MYIKKASVSGELIPLVKCYANFIGSIYHMVTGHVMVITSIRDGKHMKGSLHYVGKAFDVRSRDMSASELITFIHLVKQECDSRLDIVKESNHIHIEYDPH